MQIVIIITIIIIKLFQQILHNINIAFLVIKVMRTGDEMCLTVMKI